MFSFFGDLLGAGAPLYHLLVILTLGAMAIISLVEWRHMGNEDHRRMAWAFGTLLVPRVALVVLESFDVAIAAPFIGWMEAVSLALLGWAFIAPIVEPLFKGLYLPISLGATFLLAAVLWPFWHMQWQRAPGSSYAAFWQQPIWYVLYMFLALIPALILLLRRQREEHWMAVAGFVVLWLGFITLSVSSLLYVFGQVEDSTHSSLTGVGRMISLLGYPLFAVAVYRIALRDMWGYRHELQTVSEEALRQAKEVFFLVEASRSIGESLDLDTILQRVVESATMALDADRAAIFLLDPDDPGVATLAAQYTPLQRTVGTAERPTFPLADQPTLNYALQRRKPLVLNAEADNPRLQALYELLSSRDAGPTIVQPLLHQRRVLGALVVGNDHSQRAFESGHGRLCQSIAVQVTAAIENARLYRDLQMQARQLAELLQTQEDESRRKMAILESVAEGVIVSDGEGHIVIVNAAAERILKTSRKRILGRSLKHLTGHVAPESSADWESIAESDTPLQSVFELESRVVHASAAPVLTPAGDNIGSVAVLRDITRETEAEQSKGEFITAISHELRTPLTAIRGYAEALSTGMVGTVTESQAHFLGIIRDNVLRLSSFAENLIAISELEKGGLRLEYVETDLHLVVGEVVSAFRGELDTRQLELRLELDHDMPAIEADPARVRQILDNLVSNAVKFTYPGGCVTLGAELLCDGSDPSAEAHCAIWVEDTGIGISLEERAHIWERFYRPASPLAVEASGLGVGLSIVRSLVEAHNGRVWLDSTPGVGSRFTVLLPAKRPHPVSG